MFVRSKESTGKYKKYGCYIALSLLVFFFFPLTTIGQGAEEPTTRKEIWAELYLFKEISPKFSAFALFNSLFQNGVGSYDNFVELGVKSTFSPHFYLEGYYRHERYREEGKWLVENRPQLRFGTKFKIGNWSLRNRLRFEYRMLPAAVQKIRYRTDFRFIPPEPIRILGFRPFYTTEVFVSKGKLGRTRNYLGFFREGQSRTEPWIYVSHQGDLEDGGWKSTLVVGGMLLINL
ncbi:hypothetical protein GCM10028791_21950 [Echinicola sediminis]